MRPRPNACADNRQRLGIFDTTDDEDREDLAFLTTIARQAEREATTTAEPKPAGSRRVEMKALDEGALEVFREFAPERERNQVMRTVRVPDVQLGDLLEELATTASALRLRRAA